MNTQLKKLLVATAFVSITVGSITFALSGTRAWWETGEQRARVWFYDLSEKRLYALPVSTLPPQPGVGGKRGDGVRAVVVAFGPDARKSGERRVAYLETYRPELKQLLDQVKAARAKGEPFAGSPPSPESDFYQTNTLVKRADEDGWHPLNSPEAAKITTEWRSWRGLHGEAPLICVP